MDIKDLDSDSMNYPRDYGFAMYCHVWRNIGR